jgi:homoserine acetyltransferase
MSNDNTQPSRNETINGVSGIQIREGVLAVPGELKLHFGGSLESVSIAWRLAGPAGAPVVVAMGGISASRRVWLPDEPRGGWWHEVVGPGLALDTQRFRILSFDYLGASADSTGPRDDAPFPTVSAYDQAELLLRLINHLGLAMATYRSPEEFAARFSGAARRNSDEKFVLPVEEYLFARGAEYAQRYRPASFVCLSESIDLHRVDAGRIFAPVTAIAVREDQLVPLGDMRAMVARLPNAELHEISSVYGHDAFLKENRRLAPIFANVLNDNPGTAP